MNRYNSSLDSNHPTCLPPEAYLRIIKSCGTDLVPKFKSSVYPSKNKKVTKNVKQIKK
jgi:hypothetical protein